MLIVNYLYRWSEVYSVSIPTHVGTEFVFLSPMVLVI